MGTGRAEWLPALYEQGVWLVLNLEAQLKAEHAAREAAKHK